MGERKKEKEIWSFEVNIINRIIVLQNQGGYYTSVLELYEMERKRKSNL